MDEDLDVVVVFLESAHLLLVATTARSNSTFELVVM
jgi:hypothetical protein